ncbi:caspase, EACC1-associated type [Micromonospora sp. NPDC004704]
MGLPDPHGSRAVLVGCADYANLDPLPAITNNLDRLSALLVEPDLWGLPPQNCVVLSDPESPDVVLEAVHEAARDATDTLLVYFSGHGLLDPRTSDLYLALRRSDEQRLYKSVRYDDVRREVIDTASCPGKVVILDCCYSGQALVGGMGGSTDMADQARIEGTYLLTASAETKRALAPIGEEFTAFTGELLNAFSHGVPDGSDLIDLDTLYWHVRRGLEAKGRPVPQQRARNDGRSLTLVRNRHGRGAAGVGGLPRASGVTDSMLRQPPPQLARTLTELLATDPGTGLALIEAVAASRDGQEIASLVERLRRDENHELAERVIAAAARRGPAEVAGLVQALVDVGRTPDVSVLLSSVARAPSGAIAALAKLLEQPAHLSTLLDAAVAVHAGPDGIVQLARAMTSVGLPSVHQDVIVRAASATSGVAEFVALTVALAGAHLVDDAERVVATTVARLSDDQVILAADQLRAAERPQLALGLFVHASAARPVGSVAAFVRGLQEVGRPLDAYRLIREAGLTRGAVSLADLMIAMAGDPGMQHRIVEAALVDDARWPESLANRRVADVNLERLQPLFAALAGLAREQPAAAVFALIRAGAWSHAAVLINEIARVNPGQAAAVVSAVNREHPGDWRTEMLSPTLSTPEAMSEIVGRLELQLERPLDLARDLWNQGRLDDAHNLLRALASHGPVESRAAAGVTLGVFLRDERQDNAAAAAALDAAIDLDNTGVGPLAHLHRAIINDVEGRAEAARSDYGTALRSADRALAAVAALHLGWMHADHGDPDSARHAFEAGLIDADAQTRDWLHLALGSVASPDPRDGTARAHWEQAINSDNKLAAGYAAALLSERARLAGRPAEETEFTQALLDNIDAAELWPPVLDRTQAATPEARIWLMYQWIIWLQENPGASVRFSDPYRPTTFLLITSDEGLTVETTPPGRGRRAEQVTNLLAEIGFEPLDQLDPPESGSPWLRWSPGELDEEALAITCESVFTDIFEAKQRFSLSTTWEGLSPLERLPRPPVPDLLPG